MATEPPYPPSGTPVDRWTYERDRATDQRDRETARRELREDQRSLEQRLADALDGAVAELKAAMHEQDKSQAARSASIEVGLDGVKKDVSALKEDAQRRAGVKITLGTVPVILSAIAALGTIVLVLVTVFGHG